MTCHTIRAIEPLEELRYLVLGAQREGARMLAELLRPAGVTAAQAEVIAVLRDAGVTVLEREHAICHLAGVEVGIVGMKGFVGGFHGRRMPDFGEPSLRALYRDTMDDVAALDEGLRAIAHCPVRIVLLHYAPIADTLEGEPPEIWNMLGTDRLATPLVEHQPQLVLHGHAHAGTFAGTLGQIPVHNVSVPVMQRDFWIFELAGVDRAVPSMH